MLNAQTQAGWRRWWRQTLALAQLAQTGRGQRTCACAERSTDVDKRLIFFQRPIWSSSGASRHALLPSSLVVSVEQMSATRWLVNERAVQDHLSRHLDLGDASESG
jgi:hypothetical protein